MARSKPKKKPGVIPQEHGPRMGVPEDIFGDAGREGNRSMATDRKTRAEWLRLTNGMDALDWRITNSEEGAITTQETMAAGMKRAKVMHECRLDYYLLKGFLTDNQRDAGIRFRGDWETAAVSAGVIGAYEPAISGKAGFTHTQIEARDRVRKVVGKLGAIPSSILIAVCCYDTWAGDWEEARRWPRRSGIALLRDALTDLAKHYGLTGGRDPG